MRKICTFKGLKGDGSSALSQVAEWKLDSALVSVLTADQHIFIM